MSNPGYQPEVLQRALDAVAAYGSVSAASRELKMPRTTLQMQYSVARARGMKAEVQSLAGFAAMHPDAIWEPPSNAIPEGQQLRGLSTRVKADGTTEQQWVKTERDSGEIYEVPEGQVIKRTASMVDADGRTRVKWVSTDRDAEMVAAAQKAALAALCAKLEPIPPVDLQAPVNMELCTLYTITDAHVGMLAWDKETGEDWDLTIAERCLGDTLCRMIDAAPHSAVGLVNQLGDFLHFDSLQPMTPTNHHILDADSRYQKMVEVAVRILRRIIEHALRKHERVVVEMKEGNHDPAGSVWLRVMFAQLYASNPRITIDMSPNPYTIYQHGKTFLGFHHGHLIKKPQLPILFAAQFPREWGQTEYRYIHTGHLHHVEEKEHPGIKVIQHPTLAAPDAYAARGGWLSKRQATSMTYSSEFGEVARAVFIPTGV